MKLSLIGLFSCVYSYYKIHFCCMKFSLTGSDSQNSKNFMQWIISWRTIGQQFHKCMTLPLNISSTLSAATPLSTLGVQPGFWKMFKMELWPILCNNGVYNFYLFYSRFWNFRVSKIRIRCPKDGWMGIWLIPCV